MSLRARDRAASAAGHQQILLLFVYIRNDALITARNHRARLEEMSVEVAEEVRDLATSEA